MAGVESIVCRLTLPTKETSFELDAVKGSWPEDYKNVIYGLGCPISLKRMIGAVGFS